MKRFALHLNRLAALVFMISLFCVLFAVSSAYGQDKAVGTDSDKLERTRAILAENNTTKAAPTPSSWRTEEPSLSGAGTSMVKSLVLCIGIFLVGAALYKRFALKNGTTVGRRIKIVERTPLSSRTFLSIVEVDGKTVILSCGPDRVSFAQNQIPVASVGKPEDFEKALKAVCERQDS